MQQGFPDEPVGSNPSSDAQAASALRGPSTIFFGENGLRAGWSALLFLTIMLLLGFVVNLLAHALTRGYTPPHNAPVPPAIEMLGEFLQAAVVLAATWIMGRIEGRRIADYGYAGRAPLARFVWGCCWGFVMVSALVATLWRTHLLAFDAGHLHGASAVEYGFAWLAVFFCVAIFEESLLRGYLQYTLTRGIGFWWSAVLMSVLFGAVHISNHGESPVGLFSAGAVGLVFCISLWYTGSLWWAIGFHALWDWGQTYFYGTPDSGMVAQGHLLSEHPVGPLLWSGGPTGPEGSLYVLPVLGVVAVGTWLWWRRNGVHSAYRQDV